MTRLAAGDRIIIRLNAAPWFAAGPVLRVDEAGVVARTPFGLNEGTLYPNGLIFHDTPAVREWIRDVLELRALEQHLLTEAERVGIPLSQRTLDADLRPGPMASLPTWPQIEEARSRVRESFEEVEREHQLR